MSGLTRTIGLSLISCLAATALVRAADETPFSALAKFATAFSENDADGALDIFDSQMKGYGEIEQNIESLTNQADISCAIEVLTDQEKDGVHRLDVDWFLQLKSQTDDALLERRRERVRLEMRQIKGRWKIVSLSPLTILSPLQIR